MPLENPGHTYPNPSTGQHHKYPLCQEPCGERPAVCELNPRSLWPGQDTGRPWKEGQGGCTGEGMGSRGARGGAGMSRLAQLGQERFGRGRQG